MPALCHTLEGHCLLERSSHLPGRPVFVAATQGRTLDPLALVARRATTLGPTGLQYLERQFLAGYRPQGTASVKKAYLLFQELQWEGGLEVWRTWRGLWRCS